MTDASTPRTFPSWKEIYSAQPVETMPWFYDKLDPDLAQALATRSITHGTFLDLGTGPATQAIELARSGFTVTGSDLSTEAVKLAATRAEAAGVKATFVADDILASKIAGPFEFVLDRGCFHVFAPEQRKTYVQTVHKLLAQDGLLFLKCFSHKQPGEQGPYRFTPEMVRAAFAEGFTVLAQHETVYQGTLQPQPIALFTVLQRI